jgi:predicted nucleotidyltransferase
VLAPEVGLPEVEVTSDLDDEYTLEVDDDRQIWWFVESLVDKEFHYCKESRRRRWYYRTRFVGHGPDKDCWLT